MSRLRQLLIEHYAEVREELALEDGDHVEGTGVLASNASGDELGRLDLPPGGIITAVRLVIDTDSSSITLKNGSVLTGKSSVESAIAALRHGAFDYLTKPVDLERLSQILQRAIEAARARTPASPRS